MHRLVGGGYGWRLILEVLWCVSLCLLNALRRAGIGPSPYQYAKVVKSAQCATVCRVESEHGTVGLLSSAVVHHLLVDLAEAKQGCQAILSTAALDGPCIVVCGEYILPCCAVS